jgi:hypothetical protein
MRLAARSPSISARSTRSPQPVTQATASSAAAGSGRRRCRWSIVSTANAELPMISQQHALLACDLWEHAYYLDYQNNREAFVHAFLEKLVNWAFAAEQFAQLDRNIVAAAGQERGRRAR